MLDDSSLKLLNKNDWMLKVLILEWLFPGGY